MRERFRKAVTAIYWVALPISLLFCAGWLLSAFVSPSPGQEWLMAMGSGAFAALIAWRLWLNSRALGWAAGPPRPRRLLLVVLPLLVLALAGVALAAIGVVWLGLGIWLISVPESAASGYRDLVSAPVIPIAGGVMLVLVGGLLGAPLIRSLRRREEAAGHF